MIPSNIKRWVNSPKVLFILMLFFGLIVRFYHLELRAWDSDELGALFRAQNAQNFQDHFQSGVAIDGHPALVQTLLYINGLSGEINPTLWKFIWAAWSVIAMIPYYNFFKKRNGSQSALFVISALLFLWWPVSLSVWVRPYTPALFFLGGFLWSWELYKSDLIQRFKPLLLCSLMLAMVAYSHYMALLSALAFMLIEGYYERIYWTRLIRVSTLGFLFFSPHLYLFYQQWSEGGLSWLAKPDWGFLSDHIYYISNDSFLLSLYWGCSLVIAALWSFYKGAWNSLKTSMIRGILPFILFFLIAFSYSLFRKPVLQHNAMYFVLPFLLGSLSVLFERIHKATFYTYLCFFIGIAIYSLAFEKQFYTEALKDRYAYPVSQISALKMREVSNIPVIFDGPEDVYKFHLKKHPVKNAIFVPETFQGANPFVDIDSGIVAFHSGSDIHLQTYVWSNFQVQSLKYKNEVFDFYPGGYCFKAIKHTIPYLAKLPFIEGTLLKDEFIFIDFAKISRQLGPIEASDILLISVAIPTDLNIQNSRFDLVSALFQEGFNRALHQIDYRYVSDTSFLNKSIWNNQSRLNAPIKLADIKHWDTKSKLRVSMETRGDKFQHSHENITFPYRIFKIPGNPNMYGIKTQQSVKP
jgi:hypothetical protein